MKPIKTKVCLSGGQPRLYIDSNPIAPIVFFGNTDRGRYVTEQAEMAARAGIHLHSCIYNLHFEGSKRPATCENDNEETADELKDLSRCLDAVIKGDPEAKIILRVKVGAYFIEPSDEWKDQLIVFRNGSIYPEDSNVCLVSTSSEKWACEVDEKLKLIVNFMRTDERYMRNVSCVHLENCEWFEYGFRESGSDMSPVADAAFISWQKNKYGNDYLCSPVPRDLPNNISSELYKNTLLTEAKEQRFIDYFDFINELVASRIERFAKTIKETSNYEMAVIAFYAYHFELADCQSGHYDLRRLLDSPYIDGFAGPVSYGDRSSSAPHGAVGATSAYMSPADSIARCGKLWFQESDQRTFVNGAENSLWLPNIETLDDLYNVHKREIGDIMLHGCGIWLMDLGAFGWLLDQSIWDKAAILKKEYEKRITENKKRSNFDIIFVFDEKAESIVGQPSFCGISGTLINTFRYEAYRAGVSFAFAEIGDIINGKFGDGKLFIFLNPYRLSHENCIKLNNFLNNGGNKTALFMYGFGLTEPDDIKILTGMDIEKTSPGPLSVKLTEKGSINNFISTEDMSVTHRYKIKDEDNNALGFYENGECAFGIGKAENYNTIFFGGLSIPRDNIRAFAKISGIHVWSYENDTFICDNETIVISAAERGMKKIIFDKECTVFDYFYNITYTDVYELALPFETGETRWLIIK